MRVRSYTVVILIIPVIAPLPYISCHIIETIAIGCETVYYRGAVFPRWVRAFCRTHIVGIIWDTERPMAVVICLTVRDGIAPRKTIIGAVLTSAGGVFPFSLCWQAITVLVKITFPS